MDPISARSPPVHKRRNRTPHETATTKHPYPFHTSSFIIVQLSSPHDCVCYTTFPLPRKWSPLVTEYALGWKSDKITCPRKPWISPQKWSLLENHLANVTIPQQLIHFVSPSFHRECICFTNFKPPIKWYEFVSTDTNLTGTCFVRHMKRNSSGK